MMSSLPSLSSSLPTNICLSCFFFCFSHLALPTLTLHDRFCTQTAPSMPVQSRSNSLPTSLPALDRPHGFTRHSLLRGRICFCFASTYPLAPLGPLRSYHFLPDTIGGVSLASQPSQLYPSFEFKCPIKKSRTSAILARLSTIGGITIIILLFFISSP